MKSTLIRTLIFNSMEDIFDFLDEHNLRAYRIDFFVIEDNKKHKLTVETTNLNDWNFLPRIKWMKEYLQSRYKRTIKDKENIVLYIDLK